MRGSLARTIRRLKKPATVLFAAGTLTGSGLAVALPAVAGVAAAPAAHSGENWTGHSDAHLAMLYDGPHSKMLYD